VRVHSAANATESAKLVNARAYTLGNNMVFGDGQYNPNTNKGRKLIAHELIHVIQQTKDINKPRVQLQSTKNAPQQDRWNNLPPDAKKAIDKNYFNQFGPDKQGAYIDAYIAVYNALKFVGLWNEVQKVFHVYPTNVRGINADVKNQMIQNMRYDERFCREDRILEGSSIKFREMVPSGTQGMHLSFFTANKADIHLDTVAPVAGRDKNGKCQYSARHTLSHLSRDKWGWRNIELFPQSPKQEPGGVQPLIKFDIPGT